MDPKRRPNFLEAWLEDLQNDLRRYGPITLVPWFAFACIAAGVGVTLLVPKDNFWDKPEISAVFFTATVTINGLLLALSWGSFAKIYELASEPKLGRMHSGTLSAGAASNDASIVQPEGAALWR